MSDKQKMKHLKGALVQSLAALIVGGCLIVGAFLIPCFENDSVIVGVITGVVSAFILRICDKVVFSLNTYNRVLEEANIFLAELENYIQHSEMRTNEYRLQMRKQQIRICQNSEGLAYDGDFFRVAALIGEIIETVYDNTSRDNVLSKLQTYYDKLFNLLEEE